MPSPYPEQAASRLPRLIASLLTLVFLVVLVRTAWLSDDALISFRTVLNVTNGFGLTFNIAERVQTFTHPLWLGLLTLAYVISGNIYYGTFALAMLCSGTAFWLAIRHAASPMQSLLVAIVLLWSRAFVDYATSGLENQYELTFLEKGAIVDTLGLGPVPEHRRSQGLVSYTADPPAGARRRGFDTIVITPISGNGEYALGHLLLDGFEATDALLRERVARRDRPAAK